MTHFSKRDKLSKMGHKGWIDQERGPKRRKAFEYGLEG